jgi:hypothetical protein
MKFSVYCSCMDICYIQSSWLFTLLSFALVCYLSSDRIRQVLRFNCNIPVC